MMKKDEETKSTALMESLHHQTLRQVIVATGPFVNNDIWANTCVLDYQSFNPIHRLFECRDGKKQTFYVPRHSVVAFHKNDTDTTTTTVTKATTPTTVMTAATTSNTSEKGPTPFVDNFENFSYEMTIVNQFREHHVPHGKLENDMVRLPGLGYGDTSSRASILKAFATHNIHTVDELIAQYFICHRDRVQFREWLQSVCPETILSTYRAISFAREIALKYEQI